MQVTLECEQGTCLNRSGLIDYGERVTEKEERLADDPTVVVTVGRMSCRGIAKNPCYGNMCTVAVIDSRFTRPGQEIGFPEPKDDLEGSFAWYQGTDRSVLPYPDTAQPTA